jgi:hypothetical protein
MTAVVLFPACFVGRADAPSAGREPAPGSSGAWRPAETAELLRLYAALSGQARAAGFEYGETEFGDPQFYIFGRRGDCSCIVFVSRLAVDGEPRYVVQDGTGRVVAESSSLAAAVDRAIPLRRHSRRAGAGSVRRLLRVFGMLVSTRLSIGRMIEEGTSEAFRVGGGGEVLPPLVAMIA